VNRNRLGQAETAQKSHASADSLAASRGNWQETAVFVVLLLVAGVALSRNQPDPDFWGHVRYGQDMLAGGLPRTTTYSYLVGNDYPWVNHEIISELLLAAGIATIGPTGLLGVKCWLGVALVGALVLRAARRGAPFMTLGVLLLLTAINLMYFWHLRPQLLSFLCFAILLWILDRALSDWPPRPAVRSPERSSLAQLPRDIVRRTHWLWWTLPLMAFWANCHGGFVAGFAVLAVFLGVRALEAYWRWGPAAWPMIGVFCAVVVTGGLATLLNPYGYHLHRFLWEDLIRPRPEILEWRPPELWNWAWIPWWSLVGVSVAAVWVGRRRLGFAELAVLLGTLWQSLEHHRNIPFFVLAFAFWMPPYLEPLLQRGRATGDGAHQGREISRAARRGWMVALLIAGSVVACLLGQQIGRMPVMRSAYPVSAFQFLADKGLHGRLVIRFMWAQYGLAAFGDPDPRNNRMPIAFDGRFTTSYPRDIVDMYFDFHLGNHPEEPRYRGPQSPPFDGARILERGQPDLVLIGRNQLHPVALLRSLQPEWVLLYQDEIAELWGRALRYDNPAGPDYLPPDERELSGRPQSGYVAWPAFPVPRQAGTSTVET
jgi:hypothetical protein